MLAIVRPATMCAFIGSLSRPAKEGVGGMVFVGGGGLFLGFWSQLSTRKVFIQSPQLWWRPHPPPQLTSLHPPHLHCDWLIDSPPMSLVEQAGQGERQREIVGHFFFGIFPARPSALRFCAPRRSK